ncbi:MAG: replication-relaxation family protein, partial [Chloroflexi bacterium]|nr:replication-relaxation family protein [Chloroflexota bacterium]
RRMRLLIQAGYINGYNAPAIEDRIVYLTSKGANLVASTLEVPYESLGFKRIADTAKDYYFLRHFLGINDFRISLNLALNAQTELELSGFIPEYYGEKTSKGGTVKYIRDLVCDIKDPETLINYTPDGVFALEKNDRTALFFLEIDRGTEVLSNPEKGFSKAINFYYNYFISKKFQRYQEDFKCEPFRGFRVLFVTTTEVRLENMREALSKAGFGQMLDYLQGDVVEVLEYYGDFYSMESGEYLPNHKIIVLDRRKVISMEPIRSRNGSQYIYYSGWEDRGRRPLIPQWIVVALSLLLILGLLLPVLIRFS